MTALVRLYPRAWRDRYEAEFLALLDDRPPRLLDRLDILLGAVDAHLEPEVDDPSRAADDRRRRSARDLAPAILAFAGGVLWIAAVAAMLAAPVDELGSHAGDVSLVLVLLAHVALAGAALALADRRAGQPLLLRGAAVLLLVGAGLFFAGWPWLALGVYAGFLASMGVGLAILDRGGRSAGVVLTLASLLAFGANTIDAWMLLALPMALAWIGVGVWSIGHRERSDAPEPRHG